MTALLRGTTLTLRGVNAMCTFKFGTHETQSDTREVPKALSSLLNKSLHQIKLDQRGPTPKISKERDVTGFKGGRIGPEANFFYVFLAVI